LQFAGNLPPPRKKEKEKEIQFLNPKGGVGVRKIGFLGVQMNEVHSGTSA